MKTIDVTHLAKKHGFTGKIRFSESLLYDCVNAPNITSESGYCQWGVTADQQLDMLFESLFIQLSQATPGTQVVDVIHYRIPPITLEDQCLRLVVEASVVQNHRPYGDFLLVAKRGEINRALQLAA